MVGPKPSVYIGEENSFKTFWRFTKKVKNKKEKKKKKCILKLSISQLEEVSSTTTCTAFVSIGLLSEIIKPRERPSFIGSSIRILGLW